jgi:hypothetical protein
MILNEAAEISPGLIPDVSYMLNVLVVSSDKTAPANVFPIKLIAGKSNEEETV